MRATFKVNTLSATACSSTGAPGEARARLIGSFFSTGNPVSGNATGDVIAQIMVRRSSTAASSEPHQVAASLNVCTNSDCSTTTLIGAPVLLGTVATGTPVSLQMEWDKPNKRFVFVRDGGALSGVVAYTQSDAHGPGIPYALVGSRTTVPQCGTSERPEAMVDVSVDNVALNRSALP